MIVFTWVFIAAMWTIVGVKMTHQEPTPPTYEHGVEVGKPQPPADDAEQQ